jgi:uncharacterized membrane protein HdeD (DUF308 family)
MNMVLARNWWAVALRGAFAILLGLIAFAMPPVFLASLVLVFGAYAIVDGVFAIVAGLRAAQRHERWWPLALEGLVDILAGIIVFLLPAAALLAFLYLVSAWSIVTGLFRIAAAIRLRKQIEGEWLLILNGALSVLFGVVIALFPAVGLITVVWIIGAYAVVFGILLVALGFRLRGHRARAGAGAARAR